MPEREVNRAGARQARLEQHRAHPHLQPVRKHRRVIRFRLDVFIDFLLENPIVAAALRIFAFRQLIPRNFFRLPREAHFAGPWLWHVHVQQNLVG